MARRKAAARATKKAAKRAKPARTARPRKAAPVRKAARPAGKKAARKGARKATRTVAKRATRAAKPSRKPVRKAAAKKPVVRKVAPARAPRKKAPAKKAPATKAAPKKPVPRKVAPVKAALKKAIPRKAAGSPVGRKVPALDRERRTIADVDSMTGPPSSLDLDRTASSVRSGRHEAAAHRKEVTQTGPDITAGDVDADWESAYSVGDEAPGGDNPTPDQDVVDEIGQALGMEYADDEELGGTEKISNRDDDRWELDPESSEDFDERD